MTGVQTCALPIFTEPEVISIGTVKDILTLRVKNPIYFFSLETLTSVDFDASDFIKAPKMMKET